jgi:hypothetical protein
LKESYQGGVEKEDSPPTGEKMSLAMDKRNNQPKRRKFL